MCLSAYNFGTRVSCANSAEPIEMPFGRRLSRVGSRKQVKWHVYDWNQSHMFHVFHMQMGNV